MKNSYIAVLESLDLINWQVLLTGFEKGWLSRKDIIEYAEKKLSEKYNENLALIAGGGQLSETEFEDLLKAYISNLDIHEDLSVTLEKWRLVKLLELKNRDSSDQEKVNELQKLYIEFNYPEDMRSCSIYSQDSIPPLEAMRRVIKKLNNLLSNSCSITNCFHD